MYIYTYIDKLILILSDLKFLCGSFNNDHFCVNKEILNFSEVLSLF